MVKDVMKTGRRWILIYVFVLVLTVVWLQVETLRKNGPRPQPVYCINNLLQIDGAKQVWCIENHKTTNDVPTMTDLTPYMKGIMACPKGGAYTIGPVGVRPTCSIKGHELPQPTAH